MHAKNGMTSGLSSDDRFKRFQLTRAKTYLAHATGCIRLATRLETNASVQLREIQEHLEALINEIRSIL